MDAADFLVELREAGVELASGDGLRFRLTAPTDPAIVAKLRRNAEIMRLALLREMAETIDSWPLGYRRWWWQTVAYVERDRLTGDEAAWRAYESVAAEYAGHRAYVAGLSLEDQMLAAALDTWPGAYLADDEAIESAG